MKRYLGVDLHRNCLTVCTRTEDGQEAMRSWSIHELPRFARTVMATDEVAVEATGNTGLFCEGWRERGCRLAVVDPRPFEVISRSVKKTDAHDAKVLAEFLAKGLLPEVRMKEPLQARIASLTQTRDKLVKLRTILKNKINNLLAARGILIRKESLASEKGVAEVLRVPVADLERVELEILVEQIRHWNGSIEQVEAVLREQGPKLPGGKHLTRIKGIGEMERVSCCPRSATSPIFPMKGNWRRTLGSCRA